MFMKTHLCTLVWLIYKSKSVLFLIEMMIWNRKSAGWALWYHNTIDTPKSFNNIRNLDQKQNNPL